LNPGLNVRKNKKTSVWKSLEIEIVVLVAGACNVSNFLVVPFEKSLAESAA
jgi:hypothetical protein